jgi:hypothetical protein
MQNEKRMISPLLYYLLTAGLTSLVFVALGTTVFMLFSPVLKLDTILIGAIIFVLVQKSLIVGYVTYSFHKEGRFDKVSGTRVIGFYFGRLFGLLIGAFIGSKIAGGIGTLIGALAFYFVGRWVGFKVGFVIGRLLDKNLPVADISENVVAQSSLSKRSFVIAYAAIFPLLMVLLGLFFKFNRIQFPSSSPNTLLTARIIVVVLSLVSLVAPWFIQSRMSQKQIPNSMFNLFWLGLALSVAPTIYGFLLFILGASILELGVFAFASSLAAIIWSRKTNIENQKAG